MNECIDRVLVLNASALAFAKSDDEDGWEERLAGVLNERQMTLESLFSSPLDVADVSAVQAMADGLRAIDAEIAALIDQRKRVLLKKWAAMTQGTHAHQAYTSTDRFGVG